MTYYKICNSYLEEGARGAGRNWRVWRDDYNQNELEKIPILCCDYRFRAFCADFSLLRGWRFDYVSLARRTIVEVLEKDCDNFARIVDEFVDKMNNLKDAGEHNRSDVRQVSLLSKVRCIWNPEKFTMWDQYAPLGLSSLTKSQAKFSAGKIDTYFETFDCYFNYLSKNIEWGGFLCEFAKVAEDDGVNQIIAKRRILDTSLLGLGKEIKAKEEEKRREARLLRNIEGTVG